ncbi:phosphoglycerate dehydrogenase [uncultured Propionivibrio sp.]|uniref:phosphoglycerate dehydrogenase n=1 Tax=uncultured Propionivibrio sp. TaxID=426737 RepID=UPI0029C01AE0|nr:phosphoglycerate dehydrogenase [uncultured Propionivibrio sp.]
MKVINTSPSFAKYSTHPVDVLSENGFALRSFPADVSLADLKADLADADALIVAFTEVNAELLDCAPNVKIVCKHGVGVDNIDLEETRKRGIWVTNVPNANKHAVADFAFALVLALARQIPQADAGTKAGRWPRIFATDVYGKTLGICGLGNIGKQVALRAKGFNMRVLAFDFYKDQAFADANGITFVSKEELLAQSDFITLHMPLTDTTRDFIAAADFAAMKKSAYLVNASRGGVVSEADLYSALSAKTIAGAASDVFEQEPLESHPLFGLENFIATSHIAGYTDGAVNAIGEECVEAIVAAIVHKTRPQNVMNGR